MSQAYSPTWLRGREVYDLFDTAEDAEKWLSRAVIDRGIVADREADPKKDLFRLPHVVRWHARRSWRAFPDAIDWTEFTIEAPHQWKRLFPAVPIETSREVLTELLKLRPRRGGRRPVADWDVAELLIREEIVAKGYPDDDGPPGWQCQADVERYVSDALSARNEEPGKTAVRDHVVEILRKIKAEN